MPPSPNDDQKQLHRSIICSLLEAKYSTAIEIAQVDLIGRVGEDFDARLADICGLFLQMIDRDTGARAKPAELLAFGEEFCAILRVRG